MDDRQTAGRWVSAWSTSPVDASLSETGMLDRLGVAVMDVSARTAVQLTAGGTHVRLTLSNIFGVLPLHVAAYSFIATLAVILHYDWIMALLALASAPFLLITSRRLIGGMRSHQQKLRQVSSELMAYETETFHNLDAIKGFGITDRYSAGLRQQQENFRKASLDYNLFSIRAEALLSILGSAVQMAAFCYCLYLLWSGKILYGTMTLFLSQGTKLTSAFNSLVRSVPSFLNASVSAHRIRDLFALRPEPTQAVDDTLERAAAQGFTLQVEAVDFAYDPTRSVLCHATLTAAPGEIVALIGPSGGGKTTMIRLLLGLIRPSEGRAASEKAAGRGHGAVSRGRKGAIPSARFLFALCYPVTALSSVRSTLSAEPTEPRPQSSG